MDTKYGKAIMNGEYYVIATRKEGNHGQYLHRLIYEDYHGVTLLPSIHVHHIDGNKINNNINNLKAIPMSEHNSLHHKNKTLSKETRDKISKELKGNKCYKWKDHARIIKAGQQSGKPVYALINDGKRLKRSVDISKLLLHAKELHLEEVEVLGELRRL